jgi:hypothetical protein
MSDPTAYFSEGQIFWKGSNPRAVYLPRDDAQRRRDNFARYQEGDALMWPIARIFVRDLDAAITEYDTWEEAL